MKLKLNTDIITFNLSNIISQGIYDTFNEGLYSLRLPGPHEIIIEKLRVKNTLDTASNVSKFNPRRSNASSIFASRKSMAPED